MKDHESLQTGAIVSKLPNTIQDQIDNFFPYGVMSTRKVVCCVFLSRNELFGMEELAICARANFIHDSGFQVHKNAAWHVFPCARLAEKGVECIISTANGLIRWHLTVWLDAVFEAEELPACIPNLDASLAHMDANALTHGR